MALQDYANLSLFVDGTFQSQLTSLEKETNSGQQSVDLLAEGLGGFSPGSGRVTLNIGFAIPIGGQEFDFDSACAEGGYHTVQVPIGGKTYVGDGKFITCRISQSVNNATEGTVQWEGELKKLE